MEMITFKINLHTMAYAGFSGIFMLSGLSAYFIFRYNIGMFVWRIIGRKSFWFFVD